VTFKEVGKYSGLGSFPSV